MPPQTEELIQLVNSNHAAIMAGMTKADKGLNDLGARLTNVEQELVRSPGTRGQDKPESLGAKIVASDAYKRFAGEMNMSGKVSIKVENALTTAPDSAGSLAPADTSRARDPLVLPRTRLFVRDILGRGTTQAGLVEYTKQTGRTNNASVVSEGTEKPESSIVFELAEAPIRVIATWIPASKQIIADAPRLRQFVDTELRFMIAEEEENQILFGDGVGQNLEGLTVTATPFVPPFEVEAEQRLDVLLQGIAQAQQSKIPASAIIVNDLDWMRILATKNADGDYIGQGPFGTQLAVAWTLPVVATPAMPETFFMAGNFDIAVELIDRQLTEVLISDSHADFFIKNMLAILAEERVGLATKIPEAYVYGQFPQGSGT